MHIPICPKMANPAKSCKIAIYPPPSCGTVPVRLTPAAPRLRHPKAGRGYGGDSPAHLRPMPARLRPPRPLRPPPSPPAAGSGRARDGTRSTTRRRLRSASAMLAPLLAVLNGDRGWPPSPLPPPWPSSCLPTCGTRRARAVSATGRHAGRGDPHNPPQRRRAPSPAPCGRPKPWGRRIRPLQPLPSPPSPSAPSHTPPTAIHTYICMWAPRARRTCVRAARPQCSRCIWPLMVIIKELLRVVGDLHRPRGACAPASPARKHIRSI